MNTRSPAAAARVPIHCFVAIAISASVLLGCNRGGFDTAMAATPASMKPGDAAVEASNMALAPVLDPCEGFVDQVLSDCKRRQNVCAGLLGQARLDCQRVQAAAPAANDTELAAPR